MQHPARIRDGHLESARSGDDGEGAEVDSALPRHGHFVRDRGLLLGRCLILLLGHDRLGLGVVRCSVRAGFGGCEGASLSRAASEQGPYIVP